MKRLILIVVAAASLATAASASASTQRCRVRGSFAEATEHEVFYLKTADMPPRVLVTLGLRRSRCDVANQVAVEAWSDAGRNGRPFNIGPTNSRESRWRFRWHVSTDLATGGDVSFSARVVAAHGRYRVTLDLEDEYSNDHAPWEHCGRADC
jgi:hypothetical protein